MRTGTLVAALTVSGALGGVAGALLVQGGAGPSAPPARESAPAAAERDPAVEKELASLRARLDEMQASVSASSEDAVRFRRELDQEKKAAAESRERLALVEAGPTKPHGYRIAPNAGDLSIAGRDGAFLVGTAEDPAFTERLKKIAELRRKNEEERWAAARDALGLSTYQEEELKAALKERREAIREAIKLEARDVSGGDGSAAISVSMPDATKMMEARKRYDDRVNTTLNADQQKKWREDGYEGSLGGGTPRSSIFATIQAEGLPVLPEGPK